MAASTVAVPLAGLVHGAQSGTTTGPGMPACRDVDVRGRRGAGEPIEGHRPVEPGARAILARRRGEDTARGGDVTGRCRDLGRPVHGRDQADRGRLAARVGRGGDDREHEAERDRGGSRHDRDSPRVSKHHGHSSSLGFRRVLTPGDTGRRADWFAETDISPRVRRRGRGRSCGPRSGTPSGMCPAAGGDPAAGFRSCGIPPCGQFSAVAGRSGCTAWALPSRPARSASPRRSRRSRR